MEDRTRRALEEVLRNVTPLHPDLSAYPVVLDFLELFLITRLPADSDSREWATALLFEAALIADGGDDEASAIAAARPRPLLAAKHLLGLGDYPTDVHEIVPDTGMTLWALKNPVTQAGVRETPIKENDPRASHAKGLRARIAAIAGGYGTTRGAVLKSAPHMREIATALAASVEQLAQADNLVPRLRKRVDWMHAQQPATANRAVGAPSEVDGDEVPAVGASRHRRTRWIIRGVVGVIAIAATASAVPLAMQAIGSAAPGPRPTVSAAPSPSEDDTYWRSGWGPERTVVSVESTGTTYPAFNSIHDNPNYGDERNFVTIKPTGFMNAGAWDDDVWAYPGDTFFVRIYGENSGMHHDPIDIPAEAIQEARASAFISRTSNESTVGGQLWGVNATRVWDGVIIHHAEGVEIQFVPGSASITTNAHPGGIDLPDDLFDRLGTRVGSDELDGEVKPGYEYDFLIVFQVMAVEAG